MKRALAAALFGVLLSPFAAHAEVDLSKYPVFPNPDKGADPAVKAEDGGKGFAAIAEKNGWKTNTTFPLRGDPNAKKGGELVRSMTDYPSNFRHIGPQSNTSYNRMAGELKYESLLILHEDTLEFIPSLASHWKKTDDGKTFWFRIDPNARWSDGKPITANDIYWNFMCRLDESLGEPSTKISFQKFENPTVVSKYIFKISQKKRNWRNFLYMTSMVILPGHVLEPYLKEGGAGAGQWVKDYNTKFMPVSGPYIAKAEDHHKGTSVSLRRRKDYWADGYRRNVGQFNFDIVTRKVVSDQAQLFERVKKGADGDVNCMISTTAQRWVLEMNPKKLEMMKKGALWKVKIFNQRPQGVFGLAMNMTKPPFDNPKIRQAMTLLMPRKKMIKELMYRQYLPTTSYHPGGIYENPDNPKNAYNPIAAAKLLAEAGYDKRDANGYLQNAEGKRLSISLLYASPGIQKHFTVYQEALKNAGVQLNLELTRSDKLFSDVLEKKYQMASMAWGALLFPNPETSLKGELAAKTYNNNITGVNDPEIDRLLKEYDKLEIEQLKERVAIIRKIDGILAQKIYPYVLLWYGPYTRFFFWNIFGMPEGGLSKTGDDKDVERLWWIEPAKVEALKKVRSGELKEMPEELRFKKVSVKKWDNRRKKSKKGKKKPAKKG